MFIGHFAVGFASKRWAPRRSLALLLLAPLLLDVLWPVFVLAGWERFHIEPGATAFTPLAFDYYPWSHSLLMSAIWAVLLAGGVGFFTRDRASTLVVGIGVLSHWVLDWISHRADMPLWPGGPRLGLGLWDSIPGIMTVECLMFAAGLALYLRATRARDRVGAWALWSLVILLAALYVTTPWQPVPPSPDAVIIPGIALSVILLPWSGWLDWHREAA